MDRRDWLPNVLSPRFPSNSDKKQFCKLWGTCPSKAAFYSIAVVPDPVFDAPIPDWHPTEDYSYTSETRNHWMITVSDPANYWDLRLPGKVMLRTRHTGFCQTHIVIKTADGKWYASEEGSGESSVWMNRDYILADLHWRNLTMEDKPTNANPARKADPNRAVIVPTSIAAPDLGKVEEIGFSDLMPGGFIPATTRVNSWAVYGKKVPR
jgi:hypothetical protein